MTDQPQPEQLPADGVGGMEEKRFWADISEPQLSPEELIDVFRARVTEVMPIEFEAEPGSPNMVVEGATFNASLPMRGTVQIRVVEVTPRSVTFATLRGHPLAGIVRFTASSPAPGMVRFTVGAFARAATMADWLVLSTVGGSAQNSTWRTVVERMIDASGGVSEGVQEEKTVVHGEDGRAIDKWVDDLIARFRREADEGPVPERT